LNTICLTGYAVKDIELSFSPQGTAFGKGTIAVQRSRKNQNNEYDTDFINFKTIGKISEVMANYIRKGDKFGITGSLEINKSEKDGVTRYFTEVMVNGFDFPSKRSESSTQGDNGQGNTNAPETNKTQQTGGQDGQTIDYGRQNKDPFYNEGQPINIDDNDLPF